MKRLFTIFLLLSSLIAYADFPLHVSPAPGQVTELSEFLITFDKTWALGSVRNGRFSVTGPEGVKIPKMMSTSLGASVGYLAYFEDDAVIDAPGTYIFTIPAHKFEVDGVENEEMSFEYVIGAPEPGEYYSGNIVASPVEGTYETIDLITLTFDADVEIVDDEAITLTCDGDEVHIIADAVDNTLYIYPMNTDRILTENGYYILQIGNSSLLIGGEKNPHLTYRYQIENNGISKFPAFEMIPPSGIYNSIEDGFRLMFATELPVTISKNSVWLSGPDGDMSVRYSVVEGEPCIHIIPLDAQGKDMVIDAPGDYSIIITAGSIRVDGSAYEEPMIYRYKIELSSIDSVISDSDAVEIYNLSGVYVGSDAKHLPAGVYIVNGKKVSKK